MKLVNWKIKARPVYNENDNGKLVIRSDNPTMEIESSSVTEKFEIPTGIFSEPKELDDNI